MVSYMILTVTVGCFGLYYLVYVCCLSHLFYHRRAIASNFL